MVHDFISNFKWIAYAEHIIEQKSKILELFRISGITPEPKVLKVENWTGTKCGGDIHTCILTDLLNFVGPSDRAGRKSQGPAILPSMPVLVFHKIFCLCILFCTGNRKCNWYAGTITVNSELDSASNDIYDLLLKHATVSMVILLIIVFL